MTNSLLSSDLHKQVEFLKEVEKLKLVNRANRTLAPDRFENSAEHSGHVALMAVILCQHSEPTLDLLKVVKMLLIHDVVEIDAGDTWLYSADSKDTFRAEEAAAQQIIRAPSTRARV